mmetsp:Transcript_19774/g.27988  ORF Transcript_19774/g.27988 Transcript_19774/m.27988 type:complete len:103 (+) Transcript_19774:443-751(+)
MKQSLEREKEAAAKRKQKEEKEKREKREKGKRERERGSRELVEKKRAEELARSKPVVTKTTQSSPQSLPPEPAASNVAAPGLGGPRIRPNILSAKRKTVDGK